MYIPGMRIRNLLNFSASLLFMLTRDLNRKTSPMGSTSIISGALMTMTDSPHLNPK